MGTEEVLKIFTEFKDFWLHVGMHCIWKLRGKEGRVEGRNNCGSELIQQVQNSYDLP